MTQLLEKHSLSLNLWSGNLSVIDTQMGPVFDAKETRTHMHQAYLLFKKEHDYIKN